MIQDFIKLSRKNKQALIIIFDICAIISSIFLAFSIRFGYWYFPSGNINLILLIFASPLLALPIFFHFKLYRYLVRYLNFIALWSVFKAVSLYSILWTIIAFMAAPSSIPRSVVILNWLIVMMIIISSRLIARWLLSDTNNNSTSSINVLIYGAGSAGRQLATALKESKEYNPVAFIDDSSELSKHSIMGLNVYLRANLSGLIKKNNIKEVLLAIPSLIQSERNEIINYLEPFPLVVKSLPSFSELAGGKLKISDLMEMDVIDLLGRNSVSPNKNLLRINTTNKIVLVTGAGGSIGSEICRQTIALKPKKLILYDISEASLYLIEQELFSSLKQNIEVYTIIGSVTDSLRMKAICKDYEVQTIYHAAAYKHVPLVEKNPSQGVLNNIVGTIVAADAAISSSVETFVLISSDKAVRPTSVMGATKRVAELVLQAYNKNKSDTCFTMVRFGNVLDSSGSVLPLFRKQIKAGGPLTVTHPDVVRYFMTIPEAVELVIQAGAMARGGEVFVLDMGEPVLIYDLALKMIQLSGLEVKNKNNPTGDIEIIFTGLRSGEKLYEELLIDNIFAPTKNKLIMQAEEEMINWDKLKPMLVQIEKLAIGDETENIYKLLKKIVPNFNSTSKDYVLNDKVDIKSS